MWRNFHAGWSRICFIQTDCFEKLAPQRKRSYNIRVLFHQCKLLLPAPVNETGIKSVEFGFNNKLRESCPLPLLCLIRMQAELSFTSVRAKLSQQKVEAPAASRHKRVFHFTVSWPESLCACLVRNIIDSVFIVNLPWR